MNLYLNKKTFDLNDFQNDRISLVNSLAKDTYGDDPINIQYTVVSNDDIFSVTLSFKLNDSVVTDVIVYSDISVTVNIRYANGLYVDFTSDDFDHALGVVNITCIESLVYNLELMDNWELYSSTETLATAPTNKSSSESVIPAPYYPVFGAKGVTTAGNLMPSAALSYSVVKAAILPTLVFYDGQGFIDNNGMLLLYGNNTYLQLGNGTNSTRNNTLRPFYIPSVVSGDAKVIAAVVSRKLVVAHLDNGELWMSGTVGASAGGQTIGGASIPTRIHSYVKRLILPRIEGVFHDRMAIFVLTTGNKLESLGATVPSVTYDKLPAGDDPINTLGAWSKWFATTGGEILDVDVSFVGGDMTAICLETDKRTIRSSTSQVAITAETDLRKLVVSFTSIHAIDENRNILAIRYPFPGFAAGTYDHSHGLTTTTWAGMGPGTIRGIGCKCDEIASYSNGTYESKLAYTPGDKRAFFWGYRGSGSHPFGIDYAGVSGDYFYTPTAIDLPFKPKVITDILTDGRTFGNVFGSIAFTAIDTDGEVWLSGAKSTVLGTRDSNPGGAWFRLGLPYPAVSIETAHEITKHMHYVNCVDGSVWCFGNTYASGDWDTIHYAGLVKERTTAGTLYLLRIL